MQAHTQTLRIDLEKQTPVSPYIFSHNLEHTRSCIFKGLSAQMLRNRKFAGRSSRREGIAAEWFGIGQRVFSCVDCTRYVCHYAENGMHRRNDSQAQSVQNLIDGQTCGIGQYDIPLQAGRGYEFAVVARADKAVRLCVQLTNRAGDTVYDEKHMSIASDEWVRYEAKLKTPFDDNEGCLRLTFDEYALVSFGAVSLLPAGHFRGMRRDVIEKLKEIGVAMLRWPGGNFAGEYRWQDMFLPVDQRAPLQAFTEDETQPYTHGYDTHEIDTDDFIALCREIGAEPFLTINLFWNTPEESAAWVEYCNGAPDTKYGKMRAERGHVQPYNVQYWSLGNEMGYGHMEGPMTPEAYSAMALEHAEAMLKVSPDLKLCSSGPYPNEDWVERSVKPLAPKASYVSYHYYSKAIQDFSNPAKIEESYHTAIQAPSISCANLRQMREKLPENVHISFDEWNCWAAWFRPSCTIEGMMCAEMIHTMLYESVATDVPIMCYFEPVNEGMIDVYPYHAQLSANGQMLSMLKAHRGGHLCLVEGRNGHEAVATLKDNILTVSLINDDYANESTFRIGVKGNVVGARMLVAKDLLPHGHFDAIEPDYTVAEDGIALAMPARSVALFQFSL